MRWMIVVRREVSEKRRNEIWYRVMKNVRRKTIHHRQVQLR